MILFRENQKTSDRDFDTWLLNQKVKRAEFNIRTCGRERKREILSVPVLPLVHVIGTFSKLDSCSPLIG